MIYKEDFSHSQNNENIYLYTLRNKNNMSIKVSNFGASLVSVTVMDKDKNFVDVVLGYNAVDGYKDNDAYIGSTIGRNSNRVSKAQFKIGDTMYQLDRNEQDNNLHSGFNGYHQRLWKTTVENREDSKITFNLFSKHLDQGFPGNLNVSVTYTLTDDNKIKIDYKALSDQDTVFNMTNHSYFNLNGHNQEDILNHLLWINADFYTLINNESLPTGSIEKVDKTPFDFRVTKSIGKDIFSDFKQINIAKGYDHNFVLNNKKDLSKKIVSVISPKTNIKLDVYTTMPGVQIYSGNFLSGNKFNKDNAIYKKYRGLAIETQHFPDAINQSNFESPIIKANKTFKSSTIYKFSIV